MEATDSIYNCSPVCYNVNLEQCPYSSRFQERINININPDCIIAFNQYPLIKTKKNVDTPRIYTKQFTNSHCFQGTKLFKLQSTHRLFISQMPPKCMCTNQNVAKPPPTNQNVAKSPQLLPH